MHFLKHPPSLQARGRPQEAELEVRALLDLLRANRAHVQGMAVACFGIMNQASVHLKVLDPETGDTELIESWAGELARLRIG